VREKTVTQVQLAKALGVSRQTIWDYENDITRPSLAVVEQLAVFCGVGTCWLAYGEGQKARLGEPMTAEQALRLIQELQGSESPPGQGDQSQQG